MSDTPHPSPDDLQERLTHELQTRAHLAAPHRPATAALVDRARHQQRRQTRLATAAIAGAAILLVVGIAQVVDRRSDVLVYQGPGREVPSTPAPPPLRLVLDKQFKLIDYVYERPPAPNGRPPGTVPGPEGHSVYETLTFQRPGSLTPPWLRITIRTTANPTGAWGDIYEGQQRVAVGDRRGILQLNTTPHRLMLKYDATREIGAQGWQLDDPDVVAAVAALRQDETGAWQLDAPPAGLTRMARSTGTAPDANWFQSVAAYQGPADGSSPNNHFELNLTRTENGTELDDLLVGLAIGGGQATEPIVRRTTVRGHPALLTESPHYEGTTVSVTWIEPDTRTTVLLTADVARRADADRAIESLRAVDEQTWDDLATRCPPPVNTGTFPYPQTTTTPPRCQPS